MGWGTQSSAIQEGNRNGGALGVAQPFLGTETRMPAVGLCDASVSDGGGDKSMRAGGFREGLRREAGNSGRDPDLPSLRCRPTQYVDQGCRSVRGLPHGTGPL